LLEHQRRRVVGIPYRRGSNLPPDVHKRVKSVLRQARRILEEIWEGSIGDCPPANCPEELYASLRCKLDALYEEVNATYERKGAARPTAIRALRDYLLQERLQTEGQRKTPKRRPSSKDTPAHPEEPEPPEREEAPPPYLGRIAPTTRTPATVGRFSFWAGPGADLALGELIVAESPPPQRVKLIASVEELRRESNFDGPLDHYAAHDLGQPDAELATEPIYPLLGEAAVLYRSDGRSAPPGGAWPIRPATAREAEDAINHDVPLSTAIPAGLVPLREGYAVARLDLRFLAGPEGGHVNITGISGVAAKTSYAVFLLTGLLASSARVPSGIAALMFNVKEEDLMHLDTTPEEWARALQLAREAGGPLAESAEMYRRLSEDYPGLDPGRLFQRVEGPYASEAPGIVYLAPQHPEASAPEPYTVVGEEKRARVLPIQFDLKELGDHFLSAFDPGDLDDKMESLLERVLNEHDSSPQTLAELEDRVKGMLDDSGRGNRNESVHTLRKLWRRLGLIRRDLRGLVAEEVKLASPPDLRELLRPGRVVVVDVTQISERARRALFSWLVSSIEDLLIERKARAGSVDAPPPEDLSVAGRILVFADELNRFAPRTGHSMTGSMLGRIASQGRSYGFGLVGLQQQASRVNEQILTNSSTFAVGHSHFAELNRRESYGWMSQGLKAQAANLDKGQMIVAHPTWGQPLILRFPLPHHRLIEQALVDQED